MPAPKDDPRAIDQRSSATRGQKAQDAPAPPAEEDVTPATGDAPAPAEAPTEPDVPQTDGAAADEPAPEPPPEPDVLLVLPDGATIVAADGTPYRPSHGDPVHVRPDHARELLERGAQELPQAQPSKGDAG